MAPWDGLSCRPSSGAAFDYLEQPGRSYKMICRWSLTGLDLVASGRDHAANHGQLFPVLVLGCLRKRFRVRKS